MLSARERWVGPVQIRRLLDSCLDGKTVLVPPEVGSAYLVTRHAWQLAPGAESRPLYVGGITGKSDRFRTRIGDVMADAFGFYTAKTGHSSGGQSIHRWCLENQVNPADLHLAWVEGHECHRCLEGRLYEALSPELNRNIPSRCTAHPRMIRPRDGRPLFAKPD
jgi:hypothetical protein